MPLTISHKFLLTAAALVALLLASAQLNAALAEKKARDVAIAAWEQNQAKQLELLEKQRAEREAHKRAREDASRCAYKPVMTNEDLERCRQARR